MHRVLSEVNLVNLPGIPRIWIDFLCGRLSTPPASQRMDELLARTDDIQRQAARREDLCRLLEDAKDLCSDRALENLQRLKQPGSIAVVANLSPALFGGPEFQIFKCLTAIKVCEHLAQYKLTAVPICWIQASPRADFPTDSIQLLDAESELRCLGLQKSGTKDLSAGDILPVSQINGLLAQMDDFGQGAFDPEIFVILRASFESETTFAQATARLIAALMEEWGILVVNSAAPDYQSHMQDIIAPLSQKPLTESVVQSMLLPVAAFVVDPFEINSYLDTQPEFETLKSSPPMAWPQCNATIMDARSRKILERYRLDLHQLYAGEGALIRLFADSMPREASAKLLALKLETENQVDKLTTLYSAGGGFGKTAASIKERIEFQLNRLREHFDAASERNRKTMNRHIRRVCNLLAPNGRTQERELAGIQLPLRYSRAVIRSLYEKLDILNTEHQLISMD